MNLGYWVELRHAERDGLKAPLTIGRHPVRKFKRMQILLALTGAYAGATGEKTVINVTVSGSIVYRTKCDFVLRNLERRIRPRAHRKLSGQGPPRYVRAEAGA